MDEIRKLAAEYDYEPWRVRAFDLQREGVHLRNPPESLLPEDLRRRFLAATLVLQANGFTFTASETSSVGQIETPYRAAASEESDGRIALEVSQGGEPVGEFGRLHLVEVMGRPSDHYFAFKKADGTPLPAYLVVNPYENCAFRCRYCSRLPHFARASHAYRENLEQSIREVLAQAGSADRVRFINIITGSQADAEADLEMVEEIVGSFDRAGFNHCEYGVYSSNLRTRAEMERFRRLRVILLTVTVETTTDEARRRLHEPGNPKREMSFEHVLGVIREAERVFPYVNTTMMLGYESADDVVRGFTRLAEQTRSTINHYIPRLWLGSQKALIHPEARTLEYYVKLFAFIERRINAGRRTVASFFEERFGIPPFRVRYRS